VTDQPPDTLFQIRQCLFSSFTTGTTEELAVALVLIHKLSSAKTENLIPAAKA
jgi:hypothetical protein